MPLQRLTQSQYFFRARLSFRRKIWSAFRETPRKVSVRFTGTGCTSSGSAALKYSSVASHIIAWCRSFPHQCRTREILEVPIYAPTKEGQAAVMQAQCVVADDSALRHFLFSFLSACLPSPIEQTYDLSVLRSHIASGYNCSCTGNRRKPWSSQKNKR